MNDPALHGFPIVVTLDVAWGDMDAYGHVNNVVYFRYFEQARIAYLDRIGWLRLKEEAGLGPIVAATSARYRKPLTYPDRLYVAAKAVDILDDRVRFLYRLASTRLQTIAAEGDVLVVSYDYRRSQKTPIPEAIRAAILALETPPPPAATANSAS